MEKKPKTPPPVKSYLPTDADPTQGQVCQGKCGLFLAFSAFDHDSSKPNGYRGQCKACRKADEDAQKVQDVIQFGKELDRETLKVIRRMHTGRASAQAEVTPHIATLLQRLMEAFGGAAGYAEQFAANYLAATPGGQVRQRQLDAIMRLNVKVTESGATQKPLSAMTDYELEAIREEKMKRLQVVQCPDGAELHTAPPDTTPSDTTPRESAPVTPSPPPEASASTHREAGDG